MAHLLLGSLHRRDGIAKLQSDLVSAPGSVGGLAEQEPPQGPGRTEKHKTSTSRGLRTERSLGTSEALALSILELQSSWAFDQASQKAAAIPQCLRTAYDRQLTTSHSRLGTGTERFQPPTLSRWPRPSVLRTLPLGHWAGDAAQG